MGTVTVSDANTQKLYAWEQEYLQPRTDRLTDRLPRSAIGKLLRRVLDDAGIPQDSVLLLDVADIGNTAFTLSIPEPMEVIYLPPGDWGHSKITILHELAHVLAARRGQDMIDKHGHGPYFTRIFMDLLVEHGGFKRRQLQRSADKFNVKWRRRDERKG